MLAKLFDHLVEGVVLLDKATLELSYMNKKACEILGRTAEEVKGLHCYDFVSNKGMPCQGCAFSQTGFCNTIEFDDNYQSDDGRIYEVNTEIIKLNGREYRAFYLVDITESVEIRKRQQDSLSLYMKALEASGIPYWEYDIQTHNCVFSKALIRLTGATGFSGMVPEELDKDRSYSRNDRKKVRALYERIFEGEDYVEDVCEITLNGIHKFVALKLTVIYDADGSRSKAVGVLEDISEKKAIAEGFYMASMQNDITFMSYDVKNDCFERYTYDTDKGYKNVRKEKITLNSLLRTIHPDDRKLIAEALGNAYKGVREQEIVVRIKTNDFAPYGFYEAKITTEYDELGNASKLFISRRDVTEESKKSKFYQSQLAYLEAFRKKSLFYAQVAIEKDNVFNVKSRYTRFKKDIEGHTLEHFVSSMCKYISEEDRNDFIFTFSIEKILSSYEVGVNKFDIALPFMLTDKRTIYARFELYLLKNPVSREIEGYITVHDETEERLAFETARTIAVLDYDSAGIINTCTGSVRVLHSSSNNTAVGIEKEESDYMDNLTKLIHNMPIKNQNTVVERFSLDTVIKNIKENGKYQDTMEIIYPDKVTHYLQISYIMVENFENRILMGVRDVSDIFVEERKKREILKQALQEAKAGENAKMDFLSRMSHDLRTPLNGILGMAQIALDESNEEEIKDYQRKIISSGQMLLSLVNDILDISQSEEKKLILHPESYAMADFEESLNIIIGEQCKSKGVTYDVNIKDIEGKYFEVDKLRFGQIFLNLLSNACKYTPEGGKVSFGAKITEADAHYTHITFTVKDTGIGMTEEFIEHAFDAFSQAHTSTIDTRLGSGLGLAIVKQLVDLFKGRIEIKSKKNEGTSVFVYLRLKNAEAVIKGDEVKEEKPSEVLAGKRALVVEDQPLNAKILIKLLKNRDMIVDFAEDGKKAVYTYLESKEGMYDVILMDVRMPVMDGISATRVIRSHKERADYNLPIIATTANAYIEDKENCINAGMNDHIAKPINAKELYRVLSEYLH
ncbi:MAG: response regulator [Lachnospiraceae bacterium]|nr:response regulator [Lachnospiraceae bacterium]